VTAGTKVSHWCNMRIRTLHREQWIAKPLAEVFGFFCEARNLDLITPPWLHFRVLKQTGYELRAGTLIHYRLAWHRLPLDWTSRIEEWRPPHRFVDLQLKGPYRLWHHTHSFVPFEGGTLISDTVRYAVPLGTLGDFFAGSLVQRDVERIFDYRTRTIAAIFHQQTVGIHGGRNGSC
jgi:ligand-binding SRPBCC domain-containing protein